MTALEYVEMKAREEDRGITMEKCRAALGALGIQNSMALNKIGGLGGLRLLGTNYARGTVVPRFSGSVSTQLNLMAFVM